MDLLISYIVPFLIILTIVVFVHELGHYLVARYNGIRVDVFSIGFGRELFGWTDRHGTRWKVSLIPLGGYVRMFGDADEASATSDQREMTDEQRAVSFRHKRVGQRAAVVAAGPLANFLFAIVVFAVMFMTAGQPVPQPVVGNVIAGSAAEAAGFQRGDRLLRIDGTVVEDFTDIQRLVQLSDGTPMQVELERGGATATVTVTPRLSEHTDHFGNVRQMPMLGIGLNTDEPVIIRTHGPISAVAEAFGQCYKIVHTTLINVGQMIMGMRGTDDLGGPLRIAQVSGQAAQLGLASFVMFIGVLSVNLGLINLFPIPLLDGGHLLFYAIEGMLGRPMNERAQEVGLRVGLALVFGLMVFATWNDLVQLKVWDFVKGLVS